MELYYVVFIIGLIATGITGVFIGMLWRNYDVERRVKSEKLRLEQVEKATSELNKLLSGSDMIGSYDLKLAEMDSGRLFFLRSILLDVDLAARMRDSKKRETNEANHN